jgi:hypothetical protein
MNAKGIKIIAASHKNSRARLIHARSIEVLTEEVDVTLTATMAL